MLGGVAALIARLGMRREVALYCELNAPLMSRRSGCGRGSSLPSSKFVYDGLYGLERRARVLAKTEPRLPWQPSRTLDLYLTIVGSGGS